MNDLEISKAQELSDCGLTREMHDFIKPFLDDNDPYAIYLSGSYSLSEWNETAEEFDRRNIECLLRASNQGVAPAMYRLSSAYYTGEYLNVDMDLYKHYLSKAFELGFGPAKLSVATNYFYGVNGYPEDKSKGLSLIQEAVNENVEGAVSYLEDFQRNT